MKKDLMEQIRKANHNLEEKEFPNQDAIWDKVEQKLDDKEKTRRIIPWKLMAVAASIALVFTAGLWVFKGYQANQTASELDIQNIQVPEPTAQDIGDVEEIREDLDKPAEGQTLSEPVQQTESVTPKPKVTPTVKRKEQPVIADVRTEAERRPVVADQIQTERIQAPQAISSNEAKFSRAVTETIITEETIIIEETISSESVIIDSEVADILLDEPVVAQNSEPKTIDLGVISLERTNQLDAVVVTGYGKTESKKFKGSNSVRAVDAPVQEALQGRVAGVAIQNGSGQPGSAATVRLRGASTINANDNPLYVVDGQVISEEEFTQLNTDDVSNVEVIKDTGATALYGSRASNGVVVITTKNGNKTFDKKKSKKPMSKAKQKRQENKKLKELAPFIDVSNEDYESFIENQFESPQNAPLSTFSIDVDNASYSNVRRFINQGQTVPKDAVRIEEMVNYFDYEYNQPKGNDPIAIHTEISQAPWNENHKLMKIGLQAKDIPKEELPASNLVFLIDVSGSMSDQNKLPLLKSSMRLLVDELRDDDKVSMVVYAGAAGVVLEPTNDKDDIIAALDQLSSGGSTAGGEGIELAYDIATENFIEGGNNRVILATDGDFNVGASTNSAMEDLIEEKRKSGVFLTCLGYGMGNFKDSKMEILADKGNGNYAYIDNIQEANKFLVKEFAGSLFTLAKDVKLQIEFNPKHVKSYRLIGYENRKLRPEDFTNDAIDAGELGAGHTVTAFYEIIPTGVESDFFQETPDLRYSETESKNNFSDELATVKFRYKEPDGEVSKEVVERVKNEETKLNKTSGDFQFASAVAWFGLKLRDSELISNKETDDIVKLAKNGKGEDDDGYRAEFIRLAQSVR